MSDRTIDRARRRALNRFYFHEGRWYVEAREGVQGPFTRREEAVAHIERHKRRHRGSRDEESDQSPPDGESVA